MDAMKKEYGDKGESVFYASRNKGMITGVDPESSDEAPEKKPPRMNPFHRIPKGKT